ncbi:MAG: hypothetical protein KatS3mg004_1378 [Bryobacteraceae bacterium]|nr:MAG: hypothetical protein KatS3mg004_1378 [Bryobacteraceae bacterium]
MKLTNGNANNAVIDQYWPVWFRPGLWNANPFQWSGQRQSAFEAAFSTLIPIDFDGDGDLDLVGSAFYNPRAPPCTLHAYRNDGKGHFTEATKDVFGENPIVVLSARRAATGDINQDGRADLILTDSGSDYFCCKPAPARNRVFIQTPDGRLAEQTAGRMPLRDKFAHESDFADIDGDESIDPGVRQQLRRKTARCWVFSGARRRKAHGCSLENRALEGLRMRLAPWARFIRSTEPDSCF